MHCTSLQLQIQVYSVVIKRQLQSIAVLVADYSIIHVHVNLIGSMTLEQFCTFLVLYDILAGFEPS